MRHSIATEAPQLGVLAAMFAFAAFAWSTAGSELPVHWNLAGEPDRYAGRFEALLGVPLIATALYVLLLVLPRFDPRGESYERFATPYKVLRTAVILLIAAVYAAMQVEIRGSSMPIQTVALCGVGSLLFVVGNLLGKIRPNWFVGIRTPWTLTSRTAWIRTHRVGGWVFILLGVAMATAGLLQSPRATTAAIGLALSSVAGLTAYSYFVWRSDPCKEAPDDPHDDAGARELETR